MNLDEFDYIDYALFLFLIAPAMFGMIFVICASNILGLIFTFY